MQPNTKNIRMFSRSCQTEYLGKFTSNVKSVIFTYTIEKLITSSKMKISNANQKLAKQVGRFVVVLLYVLVALKAANWNSLNSGRFCLELENPLNTFAKNVD